MENLSNFQKDLKQLNAKYKISEAYIMFGQDHADSFDVSSFWNSDLGFVDKYKDLDLRKTDIE